MRSRNRRVRRGNCVKLPWFRIIVVIALSFVAYKIYFYFDTKQEPVKESKYSSRNVVPLSVQKIKELFGKQEWCSIKETGDSLKIMSTSRNPNLYLSTFSYKLIDDDGCGVARYKYGENYVLSVPIQDKMANVPAVSALSMWDFVKSVKNNGDSDNN